MHASMSAAKQSKNKSSPMLDTWPQVEMMRMTDAQVRNVGHTRYSTC